MAYSQTIMYKIIPNMEIAMVKVEIKKDRMIKPNPNNILPL